MSLPIAYEAAAHLELQLAASEYEAHRKGLGQEFVLEVSAAEQRAAETPRRFMVVRTKGDLVARRVLVNRFPYALVFTVTNKDCRIIAVAHSRRRPQYWRGRLS